MIFFNYRGFTIFILSHPIWLKLILGLLCLIIFILCVVSASFGYLYFQTVRKFYFEVHYIGNISFGQFLNKKSLLKKCIAQFETCRTKRCTQTATLLLRTMDETIEPCNDFYSFACGNWISDTAAVVSVSVYDHTTIMRDRIVGRLRSN